MYRICTTIYGKKILVPEDRLLQVNAAYGLIINNGYILLTKVKSTGKLWFPGGLVEKGEATKDALEREVLEETGSKVKILNELFEVESCFYYDHADEARLQKSLFYICSATDRKMRRYTNKDLLDEATQPKWYKITDLKENDMQDYAFLVLSELKQQSKPS